jgi:hypothetical protein
MKQMLNHFQYVNGGSTPISEDEQILHLQHVIATFRFDSGDGRRASIGNKRSFAISKHYNFLKS